MMIEALIFPIVIGKIRGGKIKNLFNIFINKWWFIVVAALIEFTVSFIRIKEIGSIWKVINNNIFWIHMITYSLIIVVLFINIRKKGFKSVMIGVILNFLVIMVNGGRMPVDVRGIENMISQESLQILKTGKDLTHKLADDSTKLSFLGDIIHIKKPYPIPKSISVGDIFMILGVFMFIQGKMITKEQIKVSH
ncbi:DUF5317 domain-containing protein [Haloimpatiens sp. FM7330]|uniref:DUF5317 domain-containing protein n=1 Tax=Haloimpatiens sp. FM7330 TaxID=3298610 RepID=UPI00362DE9DE